MQPDIQKPCQDYGQNRCQSRFQVVCKYAGQVPGQKRKQEARIGPRRELKPSLLAVGGDALTSVAAPIS